ncbi:MAG: CopD family protein [Pseudomonadota bacterium]
MADPVAAIAVAAKFGLSLTGLLAIGLTLNAALFAELRASTFWRPMTIGFALLAAIFAAVGFALQAVTLTGELAGMADPEILGLLWRTQAGEALLLRLLGFGLIAASPLFSRIGLVPALIGGAMSIWSFASVGHVSDQPFYAQAALSLHLSIAAFWLGILLPLWRAAPAKAAVLGRQFGRVALWLVPLLFVAGLALAATLVGGLDGLATPYGLALLIKVALAAILLGLGALNKFRLIPALDLTPVQSKTRLNRSLATEAAVFCLILLGTAWFTSSLSPPA